MCRFGLIFRDQVEFRSEMATGSSRVRGYGDGAHWRHTPHRSLVASQKSATVSVNVHFFPTFSSTPARMSSMFLQMSYCSESFSVGNGPGRETF